jgi:hypothetical protein
MNNNALILMDCRVKPGNDDPGSTLESVDAA